MGIKDALLAALQAEGGKIRGRTILQKRMYFLSVLVSEDFGFNPHYYGPFSSQVADELGALCDAGMIVESPVYLGATSLFGEMRRYDSQLTDPGCEVVQNRSESIATYVQALERINGHPIASDATLISVAAKVHFIVHGHGPVTPSQIRSEAKDLGWDITATQITSVVKYLKHLGLVSTS